MLSRAQTTTSCKHKFALIIVTILSLWWQCCYANRVSFLARNPERLNPNIKCPGKNEENVWRPCKHGGYIAENPDPKNCGDRYVCYVPVNEQCNRQDRCADNAVCTMCGLCQKCDSAENCSEFELCPNIYGFETINYIKRFLQKRSASINYL